MRKLFVFDVDGTLLPALDSKISKATIEAVNSLLKQGHAVCIASGRPYSGIYPFLSQFNDGLKFAGIANGSELRTFEGETLWGRYLNMDDFVYFTKKYSNRDDLSVYAFGADDCLYFYKDSAFTEMELSINKMKPVKIKGEISPRPLTKVMVAASREEAARSLTLTREEGSRYQFTRSGPYYFEVIPLGTGKEVCTEQLRLHLGIAEDDVYCFGDSPNDLAMIANYHGVAMGNAVDIVKEKAEIITKSSVDDGIVYALRDILHFVD